MNTTKERRAHLTRVMLEALEATWRANDENGLLDDPTVRIGIIRGGCEALLSGQFDAMSDGVSLGLALLTLAREALILNGVDMEVRVVAAPGTSQRGGEA